MLQLLKRNHGEGKGFLWRKRKGRSWGREGLIFVIYLTMRNGHLLFSHTSIDIPILQPRTYWMTFHLHTYQVKKEKEKSV